jgi:hypothetical protein
MMGNTDLTKTGGRGGGEPIKYQKNNILFAKYYKLVSDTTLLYIWNIYVLLYFLNIMSWGRTLPIVCLSIYGFWLP